MYSDESDSKPSTAGVVNFGGQVSRTGQFLRFNGTMQSTALSSRASEFGDVFYVGEPMQVDTIAWNTPSQNNNWTMFQIVVNGAATVLSQFTGPGVIKIESPLVLNRGDALQVGVAEFRGAYPAPSLLSLYMMPR